jgi:hypothetical protein
MTKGRRFLLAALAAVTAMIAVVAAFKLSGNPPSNALSGGLGALAFWLVWVFTKPKIPA